MVQSRWRHVLLEMLLVAACAGPTTTQPAATSVATSPPASAAATTSAPSAGASADEAAIETLVAAMAAAVRAGDRAGYMALVDPTDPVFALEHGRWADEWSGPKPVTDYTLAVSGVSAQGESATATLTAHWLLPASDPRSATFAGTFTRSATGWRYAGERWIATDAPHFRVLVAPGLEASAPAIIADLPAVYDLVTSTLGSAPAGTMEIKEYADSDALGANTLLSLPQVRGWNEPGEALKLRADPAIPSDKAVIAHEFTHFVLFDRAGTHRTRMPWWLDEGTASFVASALEGPNAGDRLGQVIAWEAAGELAAWDDMAVFETTPLELWRFVYPQGYAMVRFITERYGDDKRNAWLAAMATEADIKAATPAVLGLSFDDLDAAFRTWLSQQRPD